MTPAEAKQAEANREDGWPYLDDDSDLKEDATDDAVDDGERFRYDALDEEAWPDDFLDSDGF